MSARGGSPVIEVDIFWPDRLPPAPLLEAAGPLREAGLDPACRLQPVRRGGELSVLVLVTGVVVEPFLKAMFERFGSDAHAALAGFVRRLLRRQERVPAPATVVFTSELHGADFVFTPSLPDEAFRQAIALDPGPEPGRWVWDQHGRRWLRFEDRKDNATNHHKRDNATTDQKEDRP
jgi:hypothetical protein